jgi:arthrofactin-type cyclic lipopeptide synthetase C
VAWQFRHAAEWRRRHRAADNEAHAYWSRQLAGAMPLPLSPPNGAGGLDGSNATVPVSLAPQRVAQLRNYAQDHQATLFAVLLAAYCVALARQFGIADVAVASPFANRPRAEMLRTIGLFANLVILRVREANSLDRAVEQTVQILREAHAHEQFSHTQLHGTSGLEDAVFQLLPALPAARDCAGLTMRVLPPRVASRFPLEMTLIEDGGRISGQLQFASDRLDAARARDIATTFESVAQQVAAK